MTDIETAMGITIGPGTLYTAITRLVDQKLIAAERSAGRQRPYRLTAEGAKVLEERLTAMRRVGGDRVPEASDRMSARQLLAGALVRLYPAGWRREYGPGADRYSRVAPPARHGSSWTCCGTRGRSGRSPPPRPPSWASRRCWRSWAASC